MIDFWSPKVPKTLLFLAKTPLLEDFLEYFQNSEKSKTISLTDTAMSLDTSISSGSAIDVEADVPPIFAARTHPLQDTIDEIREIFTLFFASENIISLLFYWSEFLLYFSITSPS